MLFAERFEPDSRGLSDESPVALEEGAEEAFVRCRQALRQVPLERGEQRSARRVAPKEDERVVGDADERRREDGGEGDVVVPVVDEPEVREQVDDLLLTEVPAAGHAERRQPLAPKRLLVSLGIGTGREQHRDLAGGGLPRVDQLPHPRRRSPGPLPRASARRFP